MTGMRSAIGETEFEMQQILGYAPIEPDGSFKLTVPADTPIGLAVVDAEGRALPDAHQLDPGPPGRTPHLRRLPQPAPRRRASTPARSSTATPAGAPAGDGQPRTSRARRWPTRARASTRPRCKLDAPTWSTPTSGPTPPRPASPPAPSIALQVHRQRQSGRRPRHAGAGQRHHQLPDHIQPLWTRDRGANTCTDCHNDSDKLDLSAHHRAATAASRRTTELHDRRPAARPGHRPAGDDASRKACS